MDDHGCGFWHKVAYHTIIIDNVLIPARVNPVVFCLLVSIASFFVFIIQGGELIISVAFMVGSLFTYTGYDR